MKPKIFQFLETNIAGEKKDKWENYYVRKRQKYLVLGCLFGIIMYFLGLYIFSLYGYPINNSDLRFEFLDKIHYLRIIFVLFVFGLLCGMGIISLNKFDDENETIKFFKFDLSLKQAHKLAKYFFYIGSLFITLGYTLGLLMIPVKIVMISVVLTFILYITCVILGRLGTFIKLNLNQYYILAGETIFSILILSLSGVFHSSWYFIVISLIGIIFDSLFILYMYNDMEHISKNLLDKTKGLSDEEKKYVYDIEIMDEVSLLIITIYNLILEFCLLLMGGGYDD